MTSRRWSAPFRNILRKIPLGILGIGISLSLFFAVSLVTHIIALPSASSQNHAVILVVLFSVLFIGALGVVRCEEWGRRLVVYGCAILVVYCFVMVVKMQVWIEPAYIIFGLTMILFLTQPKIKFQFKPDLQYLRKSILVVDDDEGMIRIFKRILLSNGYSVLAATTGERGLQIAKLQKPDLIVLDVILPGIKGRDVCARLKEDPETKDIPVIFASAKDSDDDKRVGEGLGAVAYLTKPFRSRTLLSTVRRYVS